MANTKKVVKKIVKPAKVKVKFKKVKLKSKPHKIIKSKKKYDLHFSNKQIIIFSFILLTCIAIFVCIFLYLDMSNNSKFNIEKVEVRGCNNYTSEDIFLASQISLGENIIKISLKDIQNNILLLPYIASVNVRRKLPDTLMIEVKERTCDYMAYAKDSSEYIKLDQNGVILEIIDVNNINNISTLSNEIILFGINFDDEIIPGQSITELEKEKIVLWEKVKRIYNENNIEYSISHIEFKGNNIILTLEDRLQVILPNNDLEYKLVFMKTIVQELDGKGGKLDMTLENPVFSAK